jgi:hypothetical protein
MIENFIYFVYHSVELKMYISILIQLDCESVTSYSIVLDVQYGGLCENFLILAAPRSLEFLHEESLIIVRVQRTGHAYKSQWKSEVKNSLFCLQMRTTLGSFYSYHSRLAQTSQSEMGWNVSIRTGGNSKFCISDVRRCKPSPSFWLLITHLKCKNVISARYTF